jgi:hypothetical protein
MDQQAELSTFIRPAVAGTCKMQFILNDACNVSVEIEGYDANGEAYSSRSKMPECASSADTIEATRRSLFGHIEKHHNAFAIDYSLTDMNHRGPRKYELWVLIGLGWKMAGEATCPAGV